MLCDIIDASWPNYLTLQGKPKTRHAAVPPPICHWFTLFLMSPSGRKLNHKLLVGNKSEKKNYILFHKQHSQ